MRISERCTALTKNGQRCLHRRRHGSFCSIHKNVSEPAGKGRAARVAQFLSASSSLVTLIEKAHHHLPSLLHWVSSSIGGFMMPDPRSLPHAKALDNLDTDVLREILKQPDSEALFLIIALPLKLSLESTDEPDHEHLKKIPSELRAKLLEGCDRLIEVIGS